MSDDLPRTLKFATIWLVLGAIVFVAYQWRQHEAQKATFTTSGGIVEIRRGDDGHYHWPGTLNGDARRFPRRHRRDRRRDPGLARRSARASRRGDGALEHGRRLGHRPRRPRRPRARRAAFAPSGCAWSPCRTSPSPLLGMDVLGRLHWQQRDGALRIDLGVASSKGPAS